MFDIKHADTRLSKNGDDGCRFAIGATCPQFRSPPKIRCMALHPRWRRFLKGNGRTWWDMGGAWGRGGFVELGCERGRLSHILCVGARGLCHCF